MQLSKIKIKRQSKKGIQELTPAIITLTVAAIVLVLALVIIQELRDTQEIGTEAHTAANDTLVGIATFSDFWVIIVLGIVAVVVIGLLLRSFGGVGRR